MRKIKVKKKIGRPSKLTPQLALKIFILARKGLTDKEIAQVFDLTQQTVNNWKKSVEFFESLKENKEYADAQVERSLFERAIGYEHDEEQAFCSKGKIIVHKCIKHYPPDPTAAIFWLKNRKATDWKDKADIEHSIADETLDKFKDMKADDLIERQKSVARALITASGN